MKHVAACLGVFLCVSLSAEEGAGQNKKVLIKESFTKQNEYTVVARGYPKPGLTDRIQVQGTARESALFNAQLLARHKFNETLDVIQHGKAKSYINGDGYADVTYTVSYPGLKRYLRQR